MIQLLYIIFIIIKSLKFITNINKPVCVDCKHFIKSIHNDMELKKYKLFDKKNIISDEVLYEYASLCCNNK
jgi:hypothetical protein